MLKALALTLLMLLTAACSRLAPGGPQPRDVGLVLLPSSGGTDVLNARTGGVLTHVPNSLMSEDPDLGGEQRSIFVYYTKDKVKHAIDSSGRDVAKLPATPSGLYHDGLAAAWGDGIQAEGLPCGYVNPDYQLVIPIQFLACGDFSEGLAAVRTREGMGFVDQKGQLVLAPKYQRAGPFSEGLAAVQNGENLKWGFIDRSGKLAIPFQFREADDFHNGVAIVYDQAIDKAGKILPFSPITAFSEDRAIRSDGKLIDPQGNVIPSPLFTVLRGHYAVFQSYGSRNLSVFQQGLMRVRANNGVVLMNRAGKFVTETRRWLDPVAPGFWLASKDDLTTELYGRDGQRLTTPSADCRPIDAEMNLVGDPIDRFGVLICPVKEFAPDERRRRGRFRPMPKMGVPMYYYSVYGWRSAEFTY